MFVAETPVVKLLVTSRSAVGQHVCLQTLNYVRRTDSRGTGSVGLSRVPKNRYLQIFAISNLRLKS